MIEFCSWLDRATNRRAFLGTAVAGAATVLTPKILSGQMGNQDSAGVPAKKPSRDKGPQIEAGLVKEFVRVSHSDLEAVQRMLAKTPQLLHVSWDWGGGDFEAGIEAASHVGDRDIALFLMSQGARANLFTAVMLGQIEIVKGFLTSYPYLINSSGAHGLGLIHHAKKGGDEAAQVLAYLESLGIQ